MEGTIPSPLWGEGYGEGRFTGRAHPHPCPLPRREREKGSTGRGARSTFNDGAWESDSPAPVEAAPMPPFDWVSEPSLHLSLRGAVRRRSKLLVDQIDSAFQESHHMQERRSLRPCVARNDGGGGEDYFSHA
jgi:hypothetical protein